MPATSKKTFQRTFAQVQGGIDKHLPAEIILDGVRYSRAALKATFARFAELIVASDLAYSRFREAVQASRRAQAEGLALYAALRSAVIGQFGKKARAVLGDFGMRPPRPRGAKTVETKAEAIARRAATRTVRHTMGPRQAQAVKGTIEVPNPALPAAAPAAKPSRAARKPARRRG